MKRILGILLFLVSFFAVNAIAFAEVTLQNSHMLNNVHTNMAPIIVKSLGGYEVEGGMHRFNTLEDFDVFLKGKDEKGLRVTNSYKPKLNLVIMDTKDIGYLINLADMANLVTSSQSEGPLYQIQMVPTEPPTEIAQKLQAKGISNPAILVVYSGKKRIPGGFWGQIISQAITVVTLL